jgi:hypothetical protein
MNRILWTLIMMRALTSWHPATHQKEAMLLDIKGVRNGDLYHLMQPTTIEMDEVLYNNYLPINLHLDTRITSWSKINKYLDLLHVSWQAH